MVKKDINIKGEERERRLEKHMEIAEHVADSIVQNCRKAAKGNVQSTEGCVMSRLAGLEYLDDFLANMPEDVPLCMDREEAWDILEKLKSKAVSTMK